VVAGAAEAGAGCPVAVGSGAADGATGIVVASAGAAGAVVVAVAVSVSSLVRVCVAATSLSGVGAGSPPHATRVATLHRTNHRASLAETLTRYSLSLSGRAHRRCAPAPSATTAAPRRAAHYSDLSRWRQHPVAATDEKQKARVATRASRYAIALGIAAAELVPKVGVEPTRGCPQRFLRPSRLPFRHSGRSHCGRV
jgi:hypothetical protein